MGEIADDMVSGLNCQYCGALIDGQQPGFPRTCVICRKSDARGGKVKARDRHRQNRKGRKP